MVNAGRILIMSKGTWDSTTNYLQLDLVSYNGVAYLARQASVGVNPSTDVSMTYWQPFGSASQIATTTTPGLVMPDDATIKIAADGTISIPIDGATLKIDSVSGMLYADVVSALSALSDVNVSSVSNGQTLIYNSSTQKWENSNIAANTVVYSNTQSGLTATNAQAAIDEVEGRVDTAESDISALQAPTFTEAGSRTNVASGDTTPTLWGKVKKWFNDLKGGAFEEETQPLIATVETSTTASRAYAIGERFIYNGLMYRATSAISQGGTITIDGNCVLSNTVQAQIKSVSDSVSTITSNLHGLKVTGISNPGIEFQQLTSKVTIQRDSNGVLYFDSADSNGSITRVSISQAALLKFEYKPYNGSWTTVWSKQLV